MRITNIQFYKPLRTNDFFMKPSKFKEYKVTESKALNSSMITIEDEYFNGHHIYFFHGGSYVCEAIKFHRDVVKLLVERGFRVTYISYPLAPEHDFKECLNTVLVGWTYLKTKYPLDIFHLFGDSAGGGLVVSLLKELRDTKRVLPQSSLLSSPWLDLSLSNLSAYKNEKKDMLLDYDGLLYCAKSFAKDLDLKNEYLSPLYGDLSNLGNIIMFYSKKEMFCIDCELFEEKIQKVNGTKIISYSINGMFHDYLMLVQSKRSKLGYDIIHDYFMDIKK